MDDITIATTPTTRKYYYIIAILLILILGGNIFLFHKQFKTNSALRKTKRYYQQQLIELQNALAKQQTLITAHETELNNLTKVIGHDKISTAVTRANNLIILADIALRLQRNIPLAIKLLKKADQTIAALPQEEAKKMSLSIRKHINELSVKENIDINNLYFRLAILNEKIIKLPFIGELSAPENTAVRNGLKPPRTKATTNENNSTANDTSLPIPSTWRQKIVAGMQYLKSLLVVYHREDNAPPLVLDKTQQQNLQFTINLMLAQAQWAVMQGNQKIYQQSLERVSTLIKTYWLTSNESKEILKQLAELRKIDLTTETLIMING